MSSYFGCTRGSRKETISPDPWHIGEGEPPQRKGGKKGDKKGIESTRESAERTEEDVDEELTGESDKPDDELNDELNEEHDREQGAEQGAEQGVEQDAERDGEQDVWSGQAGFEVVDRNERVRKRSGSPTSPVAALRKKHDGGESPQALGPASITAQSPPEPRVYVKRTVDQLLKESRAGTLVSIGGYVAGLIVIQIKPNNDGWLRKLFAVDNVPGIGYRWAKHPLFFCHILPPPTSVDALDLLPNSPRQICACFGAALWPDRLLTPWEDHPWQEVAWLLSHFLHLRPADINRAMFWLRTAPRQVQDSVSPSWSAWGDVFPLPSANTDPLFGEVSTLLEDLVGTYFDPLAAAGSWQYAGWARYNQLVREKQAGAQRWPICVVTKQWHAQLEAIVTCDFVTSRVGSIVPGIDTEEFEPLVTIIPRYDRNYSSRGAGPALFIGYSRSKPDGTTVDLFLRGVHQFLSRFRTSPPLDFATVALESPFSSPLLTWRCHLDRTQFQRILRQEPSQLRDTGTTQIPALGWLFVQDQVPRQDLKYARIVVFARTSGRWTADTDSARRQAQAIVNTLGQQGDLALQELRSHRPIRSPIIIVLEEASSAALSFNRRRATKLALAEPHSLIFTAAPTRLTRREAEVDDILRQLSESGGRWLTLGLGEELGWIDVARHTAAVKEHIRQESEISQHAVFLNSRQSIYTMILAAPQDHPQMQAFRRLIKRQMSDAGLTCIIIIVRVSPTDKKYGPDHLSQICHTQLAVCKHFLPDGVPYRFVIAERVSATDFTELSGTIRKDDQRDGSPEVFTHKYRRRPCRSQSGYHREDTSGAIRCHVSYMAILSDPRRTRHLRR